MSHLISETRWDSSTHGLILFQGGVEGIGGDAPGAIVNARVVGVRDSPLTVTLELVSGKRALLSPTGVTNNYLKAVSMLRSFVKDDVSLSICGIHSRIVSIISAVSCFRFINCDCCGLTTHAATGGRQPRFATRRPLIRIHVISHC